MKDRKIALRYARALLAALDSMDQAREAGEFLEALGEAIRSHRDLEAILVNPAIPTSRRREILWSLSDHFGQPREVRAFLALVAEHGRVALLPSMAVVYREELEAMQGILAVDLELARPVPAEVLARVEQVLQKVTGKSVRLSERVRPALLGGMVARMGSKMFDGSLRTQLEWLRRRMAGEQA